jgi:hypothetical protein
MRDLAVNAVPDVAEGAHRPARTAVNCVGGAGSVRLAGRDGTVDMVQCQQGAEKVPFAWAA